MAEPDRPDTAPVLDVSDRVSEILFGLIMALTFTGTIHVSMAGRDDVRAVLVAALGCNIAWGFVDGVMYVMQALVDRGRRLAALRAFAGASGQDELREILAAEVPPPVVARLEADDLDALRSIAAERARTSRAGLTAADFRGAVAVCILVILATFPVVVPYFLIGELETAKRVSNGVSIVLLYVCGHVLARSAGGPPVRVGLAMVGVGVGLVAMIVALGG